MTRLMLMATAVIFAAAFTSCKENKETYTVTFNSNEGSAVSSQTVEEGAKAKKPDDPSRIGFTFAAWYKEVALTNEWKFDTDVVIADVTLYAKWTQNTYTVTFNSNGGSEVAAQTVAEGDKAVEPQPAPPREGYYFGGWYTDKPEFTNKWNFDTDVVTANITLYAKWGTIKLVETWNSEYGYKCEFEYDEQNRITKISRYYYNGDLLYTKTPTYAEDDLVSDGTCEYTKNGNIITQKFKNSSKFYTIELNDDGLPVTCDENYSSSSHISIITYFGYQGGNLTERRCRETYTDGDWDTDFYDFQYDDKKGALYHCRTPKWYLILYLNDFGIKNNITREYRQYSHDEYTYEYDNNGFPTKRTGLWVYMGIRDDSDEWEEEFTYITK